MIFIFSQVFGLYKGLATPLIGNCLINTILFGFYGNLMKQFNNPGYTEVFLCGTAAGAVQSTVSCPMELAKIRMQMEGVGQSRAEWKRSGIRYSGSIDALVKIYKQENIKGCYRGMVSTIYRDLGFGVYFVCYEYLCDQMAKLRADKLRTLSISVISGGITGIISWAVVFPIDVIKTRIQMDGMNGVQQYNGVADAFRKSIRQDGWGVMTRGLGTTALRSFPCNAVIFPVVEILLRLMSR